MKMRAASTCQQVSHLRALTGWKEEGRKEGTEEGRETQRDGGTEEGGELMLPRLLIHAGHDVNS